MAQDTEKSGIKADVEKVLGEIRPMLQADGGDVELVDVTEDGEVQLRLQGHCKGCPMAQMTLAMVIERVLKERVEGVESVVPVE